MAIKSPDVLIIDLRPIFIRYSPNALIQSWLYKNDPILKKFVEQFSLHRMIEAGFVCPADSLGQENLVWQFIENIYPEGTGEFEESTDSLYGFEFLNETLIEEVDDLLRYKTSFSGLQNQYQDYVFDRWINNSVAAFTHKDFRIQGD